MLQFSKSKEAWSCIVRAQKLSTLPVYHRYGKNKKNALQISKFQLILS